MCNSVKIAQFFNIGGCREQEWWLCKWELTMKICETLYLCYSKANITIVDRPKMNVIDWATMSLTEWVVSIIKDKLERFK